MKVAASRDKNKKGERGATGDAKQMQQVHVKREARNISKKKIVNSSF
jgi:hypothetical protein